MSKAKCIQPTLFALAMILIATCAQAQDHHRGNSNQNNTPPPAVTQSFQNEHPGTKDVTWHRSNQQWQSSHTDVNTHSQVNTYYNQNGHRFDSHQSVDRNAVPQPVDRHVHDRYQADDYTATRIERPNHSPVYQVDIKHKRKHRKIYLDERGNEVNYNDHH